MRSVRRGTCCRPRETRSRPVRRAQAAMATSSPVHQAWSMTGRETAAVTAYALGAILLVGQAAVHVQQYFSLYHEVRWIGPLFLVDGIASVLVLAGLAFRRWQPFAALAGLAIAVGALGGLAGSYGR